MQEPRSDIRSGVAPERTGVISDHRRGSCASMHIKPCSSTTAVITKELTQQKEVQGHVKHTFIEQQERSEALTYCLGLRPDGPAATLF
jgi:hypothetical protein